MYKENRDSRKTYVKNRLFSLGLYSIIAMIIFWVCSVENLYAQKDTETKKNVGSYDSIEWLIGIWELEIPQGRVKMTFEWGPEKTYIKNVGYNPGGGIEHEGIIVWHPAKRKIVELSAFTSSSNKGTPSEAYFEVAGKDKLIHYFTLFYPEGKKFKDGTIAPEGGKQFEYRQIWTKKGENGLHDIFQIKRNGKWQLFNKKDKAGFDWEKTGIK